MGSGADANRRWAWLAAWLAALGTLAVYAGVRHSEFYYDDYHFVRPFSLLELRRVWYGSWDPAGIESPFYRPLTVWFFAARFWMFGLNAPLMHALTLAGHSLCAWLVFQWLRREGLSPGIAAAGGWLYAIHPALPYAQLAWLTNQMHVLESLLVLGALLLWQRARERAGIAWAGLAVVAAVLFLIKEDGVMLLPVLVVLSLVHAWAGRRRLPRGLLVIAAMLAAEVAALVLWREAHLGRWGGYGLPSLGQAEVNALKGLKAVLFLWPMRAPWQGVASATVVLVFGAALLWHTPRRVTGPGFWLAAALSLWFLASARLLWAPRLESYPLVTVQGVVSGVILALALTVVAFGSGAVRRPGWSVLIAGAVLAIGFNAPFVLVSKREQYHLLALGAAISLSGALEIVRGTTRRPLLTTAVWIAALTVPFVWLGRTALTDFVPCNAGVLSTDGEARGWWITPPEIAAWLTEKAARCADGLEPTPLASLPVVTWGELDDPPSAEPDSARWTSDHVVFLVRPNRREFVLALRRTDASPGHVVHVSLGVADGRRQLVSLDSPDWRYATLTLRPGIWTWLRRGHRVDLDVGEWYVPAVRDPASTDLRRHGIELRQVEAR